jgi:predicted transcriptional regulator
VKNGVKMGRKRAANYEEILGLVDKGMSQKEIALKLGITRQAVYRAVKTREAELAESTKVANSGT